MSEYNTPQDQGPLPPDEVPASPLPSPMDITDEEDQINPRCSKTAISQPTRTEPATLPARSSKHPGTEALASPGPSPMEISEQGNRRSARLREKCEASKTKERTVARNTKPKSKPSRTTRKRAREPEQHAELEPDRKIKVVKRSDSMLVNSGGIEPEVIVKPLKPARANNIQYWIHNGTWPKMLFERPFREGVKNMISPTKMVSSTEDAENSAADVDGFLDFLESRGCFLNDTIKPLKTEMNMCKRMLKRGCEVPQGTTFEDWDAFRYVQRVLPKRNEAAVSLVIGRLVVPSAELEIVRGNVEFEYLIDSIKEVWDASITLDKSPGIPKPDPSDPENGQCQMPTPQPDYAVGFTEDAFTDQQFAKLEPFTGQIGTSSIFRGTLEMLFPFFTAEVRCAKDSLELADQHNAHSMARSLNGVVELFRIVKREKELDRKILGFSLTHNHDAVRIYAHYPVIDGNMSTYHRLPVHSFSITALNGKERWTAYKFVMALYTVWVPDHFQRLSLAIDNLPEGVSFDVDGIRRVSY